jgi:hypothetical protein
MAAFLYPLIVLFLLFIAVAIVPAYNPSLYPPTASQWTTLEGQESLQSRLAYASLLRAGFVADTGSPYSIAVQKPPCTTSQQNPPTISLTGDETLNPDDLTLALVAAEIYNAMRPYDYSKESMRARPTGSRAGCRTSPSVPPRFGRALPARSIPA